MSRHLLLVGCLAVAGWAATGCAMRASDAATDAGYRTINAEPSRDTDAAVRANQAGLEHLAKGELDQAIGAFEKALAADVKYGPAHNHLGQAYFKQGNLYKAAWEFEYACKLLPKHAEPRNNLGLVLEKAGELDRAVQLYREAVALDAQQIEYKANLARVLIRRGDRTDEVRGLLQQIIERDTRSQWTLWARQQQVRLGNAQPVRHDE